MIAAEGAHRRAVCDGNVEGNASILIRGRIARTDARAAIASGESLAGAAICVNGGAISRNGDGAGSVRADLSIHIPIMNRAVGGIGSAADAGRAAARPGDDRSAGYADLPDGAVVAAADTGCAHGVFARSCRCGDGAA